MPPEAPAIAFGPVPSRRLGRSLGINNVPPKACSYSCVYCQVGPTRERETTPRTFRPPGEVVTAVAERVRTLRERGERIDALTFVPDGEPTLDRHLGEEIDALRGLDLPVAVISNGSLAWREDVRDALSRADWVSFKVDAVSEATWRSVNRPDPSLALGEVLEGMLAFGAGFGGTLATETMLVRGLDDGDAALEATATFLERLRPHVAYVAVPTRPPAEPWVRPADEEAVLRAYRCFSRRLPRVELLTGFEGTDFATTGDAVADLLAVTAVHPLREDAALELLARGGGDRATLERLVAEGRLRPIRHEGHTFYLRRFTIAEGST